MSRPLGARVLARERLRVYREGLLMRDCILTFTNKLNTCVVCFYYSKLVFSTEVVDSTHFLRSWLPVEDKQTFK